MTRVIRGTDDRKKWKKWLKVFEHYGLGPKCDVQKLNHGFWYSIEYDFESIEQQNMILNDIEQLEKPAIHRDNNYLRFI